MLESFSWLDVLVAVLVGLPVGLFLPTRPKYLLIDIVISVAFFLSLSVARIVEGTFDGRFVTIFILFTIFLISTYFSSRFNKNAQEKEQLIKFLDEYPKERK